MRSIESMKADSGQPTLPHVPAPPAPPTAAAIARVEFFVPGIPAPKGSMKAFMPKGWKRPVLTHDNKRTKPWQQAVQATAHAAMDGRAPFDGAVRLVVEFFLLRPAGHSGTGKNAGVVRSSAPRWPETKPDWDKLSRLVGDALTGIAYHDDARVVEAVVRKFYADGRSCGAHVVVEAMS
jgi:Holliday junction resolvase RusA-like endonuclease